MIICVDNEPISCRYCMPIFGQYQDFREWADIGPILYANIRATTNMPTVSRYWANVGFRYFIRICRRVIGTNNIKFCQHRPNDGPIPVIIGPTMAAIVLSAQYGPNVGRYVCVYWAGNQVKISYYGGQAFSLYKLNILWWWKPNRNCQRIFFLNGTPNRHITGYIKKFPAAVLNKKIQATQCIP